MKRIAIAMALFVAASPAAAQEARFCPNRPSLGTSTCTTDPGRVLAEVSAFDWQHDGDDRSLLIGDLAARIGVGPRTEVQVGWTPLSRTVSRADGGRSVAQGIGDVRLGLRQNRRNPDGDGLSIAIEGFATLPTGTNGQGRGGWSAGLVLPVSAEVGAWSLGFTGEIDADTNQSGNGRHVAESATFGIGRDLATHLTAVVELAVQRDEDPADTDTQYLCAGSLAWEVRPRTQIDLLVAAGLNSQAPELRIAMGGAMLF